MIIKELQFLGDVFWTQIMKDNGVKYEYVC